MAWTSAANVCAFVAPLQRCGRFVILPSRSALSFSELYAATQLLDFKNAQQCFLKLYISFSCFNFAIPSIAFLHNSNENACTGIHFIRSAKLKQRWLFANFQTYGHVKIPKNCSSSVSNFPLWLVFLPREKMLALAGSMRFQITLELRSLGFILSCKRNSNAISCCRAHQSSGPVRYIPKNYSLDREDRSSLHMKSCEEKSNGRSLDSGSLESPLHEEMLAHRTSSSDRRVQNQFSATKTVNLSGVFGDMVDFVKLEDDSGYDPEFMDQSIMDACEQDDVEFNIPNENGATEMGVTCARKTKQDAEKMAVELLATRAFTAVELRKKLHGKKFPLDIVNAVIADFQDRGFLNDYLYAESFSQSKWHSLSWGPRRIKQALLRKGVSEAFAEKATKQVFENNDSDDKGDMLVGMSKVSVDRLLVQASKQWLRGQDVPLETRKSRIVRWLQYRGFSWQVTNFILRKLESQYSP